MFYTIGEMARKLNVAPSTLRYYDKEGLLPFVERSSGGIRMFKDEDMEWLRLLGCLKKAGMPLKEIRSFLDWSRQGDATIDWKNSGSRCWSSRSSWRTPSSCWTTSAGTTRPPRRRVPALSMTASLRSRSRSSSGH